MDEFRQLSIRNIVVSSRSKFPLKGNRPLLSAGLLFSDRSYRIHMSLWSNRCFILASWQSQHLSVNKKYEKISRSKLSLIRPNCVQKHFWSDPNALEEVMIRPNCTRSRLWSDPIALEVGSDQTQVRSNPPMIRLFRPNLPLIRPSPDHHPDCSALELLSRSCNFGLGTHGCALDCVWS